MVFAVNCGADGSPNSFTNFKNAALAIGQQLQAEANATSAAPAATATVATTVAASTPSASSGSTGTTTSSGAATTHTIIVGSNSTISYSPSEIQANVNDVVLFQLCVFIFLGESLWIDMFFLANRRTTPLLSLPLLILAARSASRTHRLLDSTLACEFTCLSAGIEPHLSNV